MRRPFDRTFVFGSGLVAGLIAAATCSRPVDESPRTPAASQVAQLLPAPAPAFARVQDGGVTIADVAARVVPSVVNVSATGKAEASVAGRHPFFQDPLFRDFFGPDLPMRPGPSRSMGSGVIVGADGTVLTNNHVVEQAREIRLTLHDGRELEARVVGTDPKSDLAVLRVEGKPTGLTPLPMGNSDALRLGDVVLAIGNPFGVGQAVTMGIVSALGRGNIGLVDYEDFIQTDAAINPGNSGGALVNMRGELVGINTAILSRSGGYQGIGFAIPSNMVRPVMDSLVKKGKVVRGWLGVSIQEIDEQLAETLGLTARRGVLVSDVSKDSPGARAGLRRGDVILSLDGDRMDSTRKLRNRIAAAGPGASMNLEVQRDGARRTLKVTLAELPDDLAGAPTLEPGGGALSGASISGLDAEVRRRFRVPEDIKRGVVVTAVEPGSPAAEAGLAEGDVIVELGKRPVASVGDFKAAYERSKGNVLLLVRRGPATLFIAVRK